MRFDLKKLELSKSYNFNVNVEDGKNHFAGKLILNPQKITITVMGEQTEGRKCLIDTKKIDKIVCRDLNRKFYLYDLKFLKGRSSVIGKKIVYFENTLEVGFILYFQSGGYDDTSFEILSINSETVANWTGNTEKQEEILRSYHKKEKPDEYREKLTEFTIDITNLGKLFVKYELSTYYSYPDFKSGIIFPPSLNISFFNRLNATEVKYIFDNLLNLFIFLTGDELIIEDIKVGHFGSSNNGSLYYPSQTARKRLPHSPILFPLGHNLKFDQLNLPSLPLDIFKQYFELPDTDIGYFGKYIKYRRMSNVEERFLGFFRLLENLCFKQKVYLNDKLLNELINRVKPYLTKKFNDSKNVKSFLDGISRYNKSKYNTEKCIQDFFELLPNELSKTWKFTKRDIGDICKLRNDITHANDYYISEIEIEEKTRFLEVLLILKLCTKLGLSLDKASKFIHFINGYFHILQR